MRPGQLDVDPCPTRLIHPAADDRRPRLAQPVGCDKRDADDQEMIVRRAALLRLQLPHRREPREATTKALKHCVEVPFPHLPVPRVVAGIRQGDEEQAAAYVSNRDCTQGLLQTCPRAPRELSYTATGAMPPLSERPSKSSAQLRTGTADRGDDARRPSLGEVWTVDKVSPRFGAGRRAEGNLRATDRGGRDSLRMPAVLGQARTPGGQSIRGPPAVGRLSCLPARAW